MSNAYYAEGANALLGALNGGSAPAGVLTAALLSDAYVPNMTTDNFFDDISAYVLGSPEAMTGITVTGGKVDADDVTFASVAAGDTANAVVLFMDTGTPATSRLIARIDQITSFPVATNGDDIEVNWDNGAYKILSLV